MGQIIKFPAQAAKFGYKRVKNRGQGAESPNQLHLFASPTAQILNFSTGASWFERALMLDERGDPKAGDFYLKAIEEQDCVSDSFCNLGIIESKKGNTAKAFDCITNSLKHNPRHFEAHYNLGNMYFDVGDFRLAQVHYEFASQIEPLFPNAYFNMALVQAINNELAAAVKTLLKYRELVPGQEGRNADELLQNLQKSLAASAKSVRPDAS
jgi:tetratricopeptide (TPR) repeat protein